VIGLNADIAGVESAVYDHILIPPAREVWKE
jgi:hypothetical protein